VHRALGILPADPMAEQAAAWLDGIEYGGDLGERGILSPAWHAITAARSARGIQQAGACEVSKQLGQVPRRRVGCAGDVTQTHCIRCLTRYIKESAERVFDGLGEHFDATRIVSRIYDIFVAIAPMSGLILNFGVSNPYGC